MYPRCPDHVRPRRLYGPDLPRRRDVRPAGHDCCGRAVTSILAARVLIVPPSRRAPGGPGRLRGGTPHALAPPLVIPRRLAVDLPALAWRALFAESLRTASTRAGSPRAGPGPLRLRSQVPGHPRRPGPALDHAAEPAPLAGQDQAPPHGHPRRRPGRRDRDAGPPPPSAGGLGGDPPSGGALRGPALRDLALASGVRPCRVGPALRAPRARRRLRAARPGRPDRRSPRPRPGADRPGPDPLRRRHPAPLLALLVPPLPQPAPARRAGLRPRRLSLGPPARPALPSVWIDAGPALS